MKVQEDNNGRKHITIPTSLAKAMGWEKGNNLTFKVKDENSLILESNKKGLS